MDSGDKPNECPNCGSKDFEREYDNDYFCNKCEEEWTHSWQSDWKEEDIRSLERAIRDRDSNYPEYVLKTRSISINKDRCYFCNRSENDWKVIHTQIVDYLESEKASLGGKAGTRKKEIQDVVNSFKKTWSKVNSRHKVSTLMSDPHEFFPEEISKYWNEEWEGDRFSEKEEGPFSDYFAGHETGVRWPAFDHPEWYSLERLCLDWLFEYHYDMSLGSRGRVDVKTNKDVRVKSLQEQMLKQITETFEENLDRGESDMTADEKMVAEKMLLRRISSLQEVHSGLCRFSWKPWSDDDIMEGVDASSNRSDLLSINTWICPLCWDRFQSQTN